MDIISEHIKNLRLYAEEYEKSPYHREIMGTTDILTNAADIINGLSEELAAIRDATRWIPCSERMPENEKEVEITFIRKHCITGKTLYLTARAFYEDGTVTTDESAFCWYTENWDYDEEKDCYVIPEGWFEGVSFAEEFESVDMPVIAWREITEPYKPERENSEG